MSVLFTTSLNPAQKFQIQSTGVSSSFPYEDANFYILYEIENNICAAAAFLEEDEESYECFAFTAPKYRRQGLFSEILDAALEELPEDTALLFYTDGTCQDTLATLDALEAEPVQEEYMMELSLSEFMARENDETSCSGTPSISMKELDLDQTKTYQYKNSFGSVSISVFSSYYYLYGLEIKEEFRGHGHGKRLLLEVLNDLAKRDALPLHLQVSGENLPALSLYKKTGFRITETLFCYLY